MSRAEIAGRMSQIIEFAQNVGRPFGVAELAESIETHRRTTLGYLHALAASCLIERLDAEPGNADRWRGVKGGTVAKPSSWQLGERLRKENT